MYTHIHIIHIRKAQESRSSFKQVFVSRSSNLSHIWRCAYHIAQRTLETRKKGRRFIVCNIENRYCYFALCIYFLYFIAPRYRLLCFQRRNISANNGNKTRKKIHQRIASLPLGIRLAVYNIMSGVKKAHRGEP